MIKISKATKSQIKAFNEKEWHKADLEHFGKTVHWNEINFIYKATDGEDIVGTLRGKHESGVIYIATIIVASDKRGMGIGKLLMEKAEVFAREHNAHKLFLETGREWDARKFYEALGYKKTADLKNHHFHKDFVIYTKFIK